MPVVTGAPARDADLALPVRPGGRPDGLLATYSLIIATFLGTMGLPHVLVRFYTNPDGRAARRTAVVVLAMLGGFYIWCRWSGRCPGLHAAAAGQRRHRRRGAAAPRAVLGTGWAGAALGAVVAAGAWAAFLSTSSGLMVSIAGVLSTDVLRTGRVRDFRFAAVIAGAVPLALSLFVTRLDFSEAVALVFAVAASTFCPLLVLGIWWRGLTDARRDRGGARRRAPLGGGGRGEPRAVRRARAGGRAALPAGIVSVPAAFLVMVVVSRMTAEAGPSGRRAGPAPDARAPSASA